MRSKIAAYALLFLLGYTTTNLFAQPTGDVNQRLFRQNWPAEWIGPAGRSSNEFGVYHFRRNFDLSEKPESFVVHVSADNRYKLYVNGKFVSEGPAKGDLAHWRFETVDIAPYLKSGSNKIAAIVWNEGQYRAAALQSYQTAFILQADDASQHIINTNEQWRVQQDPAFQAHPIDRKEAGNYYFAIGPGLKFNAQQHDWNWMDESLSGNNWSTPQTLRHGISRKGNTAGIYAGWQLVPRTIPNMDRKQQRMEKIARSVGISTGDNSFLEGNTLTIPPNKTVTILVDQGFETTGQTVMNFSGGSGSHIQATYAEALVDDDGQKGNRNDIEGKHIRGYSDIITPDGGSNRSFESLWWRTYRYIQLDITTGDEPLQLNDFYGLFTAYPFQENAKFTTDNHSFDDIWNVGWRTVRLSSHETYMDCPYYEQMQYGGDTRIEGLVSMYVSGDARLLKKAITLFNDSRLSSGLTLSRYPSYDKQVIPPFSLFWIAMIHDYWMYTGDKTLVRRMLTPVRGVLDWYEHHIDETGMLGFLPRWNFVDWSFERRGVPGGGNPTHSSVITLQYVYALQLAADFSEAAGRMEEARHYRELSKQLKRKVYQLCWDSERGLLADSPRKEEYSQHANVMAILDGLFVGPTAEKVMQKVLQDKDLIQTTYYYRYYLFQALQKTGMEDQFFEALAPWHTMLNLGLTTFAEEPEPTRSDCHGWSSSPLYEFLTMISGIQPADPGFKSVDIAPHPGKLSNINTTLPTPQGDVVLTWKKSDTGWNGQVTLPEKVTGQFHWNDKTIDLRPGRQQIEVGN